MSGLNKNKEKSPLVKSVVTLDNYFDELGRLGEKISGMDLKSESDFEQAQRLMERFAQSGEGVAAEVLKLSQHLNEAQNRTEKIAKEVSARAELLKIRNEEQRRKAEEFRQLSDKVKELTASIAQFKRPAGANLSGDDRKFLNQRLATLEGQLSPLVEKAQALRKEAYGAKMKTLERNADSLTQSLQAVRQKLNGLNLGHSP